MKSIFFFLILASQVHGQASCDTLIYFVGTEDTIYKIRCLDSAGRVINDSTWEIVFKHNQQEVHWGKYLPMHEKAMEVFEQAKKAVRGTSIQDTIKVMMLVSDVNGRVMGMMNIMDPIYKTSSINIRAWQILKKDFIGRNSEGPVYGYAAPTGKYLLEDKKTVLKCDVIWQVEVFKWKPSNWKVRQ